MKLLKGIGTAMCLAVFFLLVLPNAKADPVDRKTVVTFSQPVEVPGVGAQTLPAGTYVFKVLRSNSDRHIVQIFNEDETHVFTTILAIPNYRLKATNQTVITFHEHPAGQPEALRAWFYPGRTWGEEFVYERSRAIQLAKEANEVVLDTPLPLATAPVESLNSAPVEGVNPNGETVEMTKVVEAPPAVVETTPAPAPVQIASLPKTASNLPLIGLLGLLTLGSGLGMASFAKKSL